MLNKKPVDVRFIREGFLVKRFHTVPHVNMKETVGHHTGNVIAIVFFLYNDDPPIHVVRAALHHDVPEVVIGDLPATAKWNFPDVNKAVTEAELIIIRKHRLQVDLLPLEAALVDYADKMDLCFKSVEELATGNEIFMPILVNGIGYCRSLLTARLFDHARAIELFEQLKSNQYVDIQEIEHGKSEGASLQ
jgi:5'-deoxynucleotidase YfbR-like HD superfamily hydrolase